MLRLIAKMRSPWLQGQLSSGLLLGFLAASQAAAAQLPLRINFQGRLTDTADVPRNGDHTMTFRLYAVPSGGTALWTEGPRVVAVVNGVFSVQLGGEIALSPELFSGASAYLSVQVAPDAAEMTPRQQLVASAYAFTAAQLSAPAGARVDAGAAYSTFTAAGDLELAYGLAATTAAFSGALTASSGTFTAAGSSQFSVQASSGASLGSGTLRLAAASGGVDAEGTGVVAGTGTFRASGDTQSSVETSSGLVVRAGTLKLDAASAGVDAQGTGLVASTGAFRAAGASQFSLTTSSGIRVLAGTVSTAGGVDAAESLSASTGAFASAVILSTGTAGCLTPGCGTPVLIYLRNANAGTVNAGCIVIAVSPQGFNTVATANSLSAVGVVYGQNCASGAVCPIAIGGVVRVTTNAAVTAGNFVDTSATACNAQGGTVAASADGSIGRWLQTTAGAGSAMALLGSH